MVKALGAISGVLIVSVYAGLASLGLLIALRPAFGEHLGDHSITLLARASLHYHLPG